MNKILIIDDHQINRDLLSDILTPIYNVVIAKDGFQGIQMALEHKPVLIICDIMMPKMDGFEVLKTIRESSDLSSIPFIFLTSKSEKSDFRFGMDSGADDYLTKPFTADELLAAIDSRLKRKEEIDKELKDKVKDIYATLNTSSAHEFNTPLNAIIGFTSLLILNYNKFSKEDAIKMLRTIQTSSKRLYRTTNNITLHSYLQKFTQNKEEYRQGETHECAEVISNTLNILSELCNRKDSIVLEIQNASLAISADDLSKIIEEIVYNGLYYSDCGKKVIIKSFIDNNIYIITIQDFGRGFTKNDLTKIGPYIQFNRSQFEQQGLGLGLYIAKNLTVLNKGNFNITSKENIGTEVTISIPLLA